MSHEQPSNTLGIFPRAWSEEQAGRIPVSYTHLTLPTSDLV